MNGPSYRLIHPQVNRSFVFKWEIFDLTTRWHCHPELELIYFIEGDTHAIIGDGFTTFHEGDLVLLGTNFPHVLKEDKSYKQSHPDILPSGLIIQFREEFLGETFTHAPELQAIRRLFQLAKRGLKFGDEIGPPIKSVLHEMKEVSDSQKLLRLLEVLVSLGESDDYEFLLYEDYFFDYSFDEERMWRIKQFVYENFQEPIDTSVAAKVANLTKTSFCRYFKSRTLKTFSQFLNEVRISYACKQLQTKDQSISSICYESGFSSLSYFSRIFKQMIGYSPQEYRRINLLRKE